MLSFRSSGGDIWRFVADQMQTMKSVGTVKVVIMKPRRPVKRNGFNFGLASMIGKYMAKVGLAATTIALSVVVAGCSSQKKPLQVSVTQLGPYSHAAKGPDCQMPILEALPVKNLSQIAIVEAWADQSDQPPDVLPALKRKACETGADALVIINSQHQDIKNLLYGASPNDTMNDVTEKNGYAGQGDYIKIAEHTRRIGEEGHNGFYVDAIAIEYKTDDTHAGETAPSTVIDSIANPHG